MIILSVLYYGGSLVTSDVLSVGNLASFVLYAAYVGIGLSGVSTFYAESTLRIDTSLHLTNTILFPLVMKGLGASTRIFDIINSVPEKGSSSEKSILFEPLKDLLHA